MKFFVKLVITVLLLSSYKNKETSSEAIASYKEFANAEANKIHSRRIASTSEQRIVKIEYQILEERNMYAGKEVTAIQKIYWKHKKRNEPVVKIHQQRAKLVRQKRKWKVDNFKSIKI